MTRRRLALILLQIVTTAVIIGALWRFTQTSQSYVVVPFSDIWHSFKDTFLFSEFTSQVVPTLRRIAIAFALSTVIGVAFGIILGGSRALRALMGPQLSFIRAVPPIALIPPAIILIGIGDDMKIILTVSVAIWPVVLNTADGLREIDQTVLDTAKALRMSRRQRLRYVTLPSVAPRTFAGLHTALVFCIIGIIATEYLTGSNGIGYLLQDSQQSFDISLMWAVVVLLGVLGNLFNVVFNIVQRRVVYWKSDIEDF